MLLQVLKTHLSMRPRRRKMLRKFLTERAAGKFLEQNRSARRITSPVMLTPSKRDLVLLASGVWPVLFHNRACSETQSRLPVPSPARQAGSQRMSRLVHFLPNPDLSAFSRAAASALLLNSSCVSKDHW
jgi:hypothetical protein